MGRLPAFERDDVIDKASQVFLRNGFRRTTIKDIAKATGLQPIAFILHLKISQVDILKLLSTTPNVKSLF